MHPGADGDGMAIRLTLEVCIMRMDQTQDKEDMDQQIKTERRYRDGPQRPSTVS